MHLTAKHHVRTPSYGCVSDQEQCTDANSWQRKGDRTALHYHWLGISASSGVQAGGGTGGRDPFVAPTAISVEASVSTDTTVGRGELQTNGSASWTHSG